MHLKGGVLMDKDKLREELEAYRIMVASNFQEGSKEPATIGDVVELAKQVYYVFSKFIEELD